MQPTVICHEGSYTGCEIHLKPSLPRLGQFRSFRGGANTDSLSLSRIKNSQRIFKQNDFDFYEEQHVFLRFQT